MVTKKIDLGTDLCFPSIAEAKDYFGKILNDTPIDQRVMKEEFDALKRLYEEYCSKTKWSMPSPPKAFFPNAPQRTAFLFDHLVSAADERERERNAERLGRLEVDEQLDFRDLLDRQISRLVAFQYASGLDAGLTVRLHKIACVTHQATGDSEVARLMDGGNRVANS